MLTLYYSPGACSLGPHIVLEEAAIAHKVRHVSIPDGEHTEPEYLAINPRGRLPAIDIDGRISTEGPAIMIYLASLKPELGLLPAAGSYELATCLEWLAWLSSSLHIAYAQLWRPKRFLPPGSDASFVVASGRANIGECNDDVESRLVGPWVLGHSYSIADSYLLAFYRWGVRIALPMQERYPRWTAWKDKMLRRPAVQRALTVEGIGTTWRAV
jgi:glutathione S-transferase